MRKSSLLVLLGLMVAPIYNAHADSELLQSAIADARAACGGISDELSDMKTMAGINTAVTGVGTAVGVGATAVGIAKASTDKEIEELEKEIERLKELDKQLNLPIERVEISDAELKAAVAQARANAQPDPRLEEMKKEMREGAEKMSALEKEIEEKTDKSKNLGNWRTGLLAANTATNIAGTAIAATNRVDADLKTRIAECNLAIEKLETARMQSSIDGSASAQELEKSQTIIDGCREWSIVDISPINKRATGAAVSSGIGAGAGFVGTITSAVANTDKTRSDNSDAGKKKEKNLNTASNVLAGTATVASGVATVFNATQISAIKKVVAVADKCEEALQ